MPSIFGLTLGSALILTTADITPTTDLFAPILSTGVVGVVLLMVILRIKIMPTYVFEDAKAEWERERGNLTNDVAELKLIVRDANAVYVQQVIPTLTRMLDAERELVDLRRNERMAPHA